MIEDFIYKLNNSKDIYLFLNDKNNISFMENFGHLISKHYYKIDLPVDKVNELINGKNIGYILTVINGINENDKIYFIEKILKIDPLISLNKLFIIIEKFTSDDNLLKVSTLFNDKNMISKIFSLIKDKNIKLKYFYKLNEEDLLRFLLTLEDKEKLCFIEKGFFIANLVSSLSEKYIYKEFESLNNLQKQNVIYMVKDDNIKYNLITKFPNVFDSEKEKTLINLIYMKTNDISLKEKIYEKYFCPFFKVVDYSNSFESKKSILSDINIEMYKIPDLKKYTFGLEIESSSLDYVYYLDKKYILYDWFFQEENSIDFGLEITSPILRYNLNSLKQIKYICDAIKKMNLKITSSCAGHIHVGFDAFKNVNELKLLYTLFANNENIFYLISNRKNSLIRPYTYSYAKPISDKLSTAINEKKFNNVNDLFEFVRIINNVCEERLTSINLQNAFSYKKNTIEFRIPNCETDYNELVLNIILYLKLVDASIKFKEKDIKSELDFLISTIPTQEEKKDVLFDLLFDDKLKNLYNERYEENLYINEKEGRVLKNKASVKF